MTTLTEQQQYILNVLKSGKNVFITGSAGTGKSFLIRTIFEQFPSDVIQICSMTGVSTVLLNAAIPQCKAKTLHSWAGIGLCNNDVMRILQRIARNRRCVAGWRKKQILVVDEVSMMSQYVFEVLEEVGRKLRCTESHHETPFGGLQVVFTGDMFQLPPIGGSPLDRGAFCFESPVWASVFGGDRGCSVELTQVFRQRGDSAFIQLLNEVRLGQCSEESMLLLRSRVGLEPPTDTVLTKLYPTRVNVQHMNQMQYKKLPGEEVVFEQTIRTNETMYIEDGRPFDEFDRVLCAKIALSPHQLNKEVDHFQGVLPIEPILRLKEGTVVMCLVNLDVEGGIVNGSQGRVIHFQKGWPVVEFTNGKIIVMMPHSWQYSPLPCIVISQIPLVLSWATTIHKSQGMTLSRAEMDLGNQIFEFGQAYVAMSRVQSLDGLYLSQFNPYKIKANPRVLKFYIHLRKSQEEKCLFVK